MSSAKAFMTGCPVPTLANDLLFIPDPPSSFPGSIVNQILWATVLEAEEPLRDQLSRILARNTCETPWSNRIDLRVSQNVAALGISAEMTLDLLNVLNFLNPSWGIVQIANPVVQLYSVRRFPVETLIPGAGGATELLVRYTSALQRDRETGKIRAARPFAPEVPTSQWRPQIGLRMRLDR